jgi:hypothetical protein
VDWTGWAYRAERPFRPIFDAMALQLGFVYPLGDVACAAKGNPRADFSGSVVSACFRLEIFVDRSLLDKGRRKSVAPLGVEASEWIPPP